MFWCLMPNLSTVPVHVCKVAVALAVAAAAATAAAVAAAAAVVVVVVASQGFKLQLQSCFETQKMAWARAFSGWKKAEC